MLKRELPTTGQTVAQCPVCGTKATVLEDRQQALLDRWRSEHQRMEPSMPETSSGA